jgi:hypothetical protein
MKDHCGVCGLLFEREEGYWAGALIINTTVTFIMFLLVFVGGVIALWPEVPWGPLMIVTIVINGLVPVLFYPQSKTIWSALEMSWHPLEPEEIEGAQARARP